MLASTQDLIVMTCLVLLIALTGTRTELIDRLGLPPFRSTVFFALHESDFELPEDDPAAAIAGVRAQIERGEGGIPVRLELVRLLRASGAREEADAELKAVADASAKALAASPEDAERHLERGLVLIAAQDESSGQAELRLALEKDQSCWRASLELAMSLVARSCRESPRDAAELAHVLDEIESLCTRTIERAPATESIWMRALLAGVRGYRHLVTDGFDAAFADARVLPPLAEALRDASVRWPHVPKLRVFALLADIAPSVVACVKAKDPASVFAALPSADRDAIQNAERALQLETEAHPDCEEAWGVLAACACARGRTAAALELFDRASKSSRSAQLLELRLAIACGAKNWSECELLGASLRERADSARTRCLLGKVAAGRGDLAAAEARYREAIEMPENAEAWLGLAIVLMRRDAERGEIEKALASAQASAGPQTAPLVDFAQAVSEQLAGDEDKARAWIERAVKRDGVEDVAEADLWRTWIELWDALVRRAAAADLSTDRESAALLCWRIHAAMELAERQSRLTQLADAVGNLVDASLLTRALLEARPDDRWALAVSKVGSIVFQKAWSEAWASPDAPDARQLAGLARLVTASDEHLAMFLSRPERADGQVAAEARELVMSTLIAAVSSATSAPDGAGREVVASGLAACGRIADAGASSATGLNATAWLLLTCEPADLRDPRRALGYAEQAVKLERSAEHLDTLALACHATGDDARAATLQEEALGLLDSSDAERRDRFAKRLADYRAPRNDR
jgi:hypothetical protein